MASIKVGIKIRPLSDREIKLNKEEKWRVTDNNSLQCVDFQNPCSFKFDHVFGTKSSNYELYSTVVNPIVDSSLSGVNGTIIAYGPTSAGKTYSLMGTEKDPGIIVRVIERLFSITHSKVKIRVGYIEIYKEKIYDLLNDRARIEFASDTISNKEFFVDCVEKTVDIFINGSYKRKSSTKDPQQLSSLSHAIFRITIESEDKTNGTIHLSCLKFVHIAGCEPVTEIHSVDSLRQIADDFNKSLMWFNFVIKELSDGNNNVTFCHTVLTALLRESLTGNSNTAFICHIKSDDVERSMSTLKFATHASNVRKLSMSNGIKNDQSTFSEAEHRLLDIANYKVENVILRKELDELNVAFNHKKEWFVEQMKAAEFAKQKLELERLEERKSFSIMRNESEQKIRVLTQLNNGLQVKCETLEKTITETTDLTLEVNESLKRENYQLKQKAHELQKKLFQYVGNGLKRTTERLIDDSVKSSKFQKREVHSTKNDETEPSTSSGSIKHDEDEDSQVLTVPDHLVGSIIGPKGAITKSIYADTGARVIVSERDGQSDRSVTIFGPTASVNKAVELVKQKIKRAFQRKSNNC